MNESTRRRISCSIKKVHFNFLTAMQHCMSLQQQEPLANIAIYKCDFCDGMHVTRGNKRLHSARKVLSTNLRLMRDPNWWVHCPANIQLHRIDLEIRAIRQLYISGEYR